MGSNLCYANIDTPTPGPVWHQLTDAERLVLVNKVVGDKMGFLSKTFVVVDARMDGQVIVNLLEPISADKRGTVLLDLEAFLKESIDPGLVVWLDSLGDRNSLRNLRGIEVKA